METDLVRGFPCSRSSNCKIFGHSDSVSMRFVGNNTLENMKTDTTKIMTFYGLESTVVKHYNLPH